MGIIAGSGGTPSLFEDAIRPLWALVNREASIDRIPARSEDEAGVVLVFMVPGRSMPPIEFSGIRTSNYFRAHHSKQMQVAVPGEFSSSEELESFLRGIFLEAPEAALKALRRQGVAASMDCAAEAARRIVANLGEVVAAAQAARDARGR
jgi:hypothetical protein